MHVSSIPGRTSPDPSNTMPLPPTNDGNHNNYGCMVDVSKLAPAQRQQHAVMLLDHYHNFVTRMTLHQRLFLHLLFPTLNNFLNPPYHHLIVDHLIEAELMGILNNQLHWKYPI